ncbi:MAG: hypothetical protein Q7K42_00065, partial [Candidatus Diapherotrites archaeon]|nr:hypothetical protein [Candidatus Diapherotrites archaeon]
FFSKSMNQQKFVKIFFPNECSFSKTAVGAESFSSVLEFVLGLLKENFSNAEIELLSFSNGDYTLLGDEPVKAKALAFLDLSNWNPEFGGFISIVSGNSEFLRLEHKANSFSVVRLPKDAKYFVKYVNHSAGKNKLQFVRISLF